jgi:hypothetical protein
MNSTLLHTEEKHKFCLLQRCAFLTTHITAETLHTVVPSWAHRNVADYRTLTLVNVAVIGERFHELRHAVTGLAHDPARQAMYIERNIEKRSCNHCRCGKAMSITQPECVYL